MFGVCSAARRVALKTGPIKIFQSTEVVCLEFLVNVELDGLLIDALLSLCALKLSRCIPTKGMTLLYDLLVHINFIRSEYTRFTPINFIRNFKKK